METKDLKKFLAGFGIASLLVGAGVAQAADQPGGSG
jgi:radical SAM modification target selenobiotic family peptide